MRQEDPAPRGGGRAPHGRRPKGGLYESLAEELWQERKGALVELLRDCHRAGGGDQGMDSLETAVRSWSHDLGRRVLEVGFNLDLGHRGQRIACGQGHEAEFVGYRGKTFSSTMGLVELTRAYYHCAKCQRGMVPKDRKLGLVASTVTPSLLKMMCRVGIEEAFRPATTWLYWRVWR